LALAAARNGIVEIAGPERAPFNEMGRSLIPRPLTGYIASVSIFTGPTEAGPNSHASHWKRRQQNDSGGNLVVSAKIPVFANARSRYRSDSSFPTPFETSAGLEYSCSGNASSAAKTDSSAPFERAVSSNVCLSAGYEMPLSAF
jgi:hypothetical protein